MDFLQIINKFAEEEQLKFSPIILDGFSAYKTDQKSLLKILEFAKQDIRLKFTILTDLFAADFPQRVNRFEVVYSLLSLKLNKRLLFKIELSEQENAESIEFLYKSACWYEREAFDMFGITFNNCSDQRRILTDYNFVGHPLRKDFPVSGHLQVKYDEDLEQVIYEPVLLEQEFREFDFSSPWKGDSNITLPGDEKVKDEKIKQDL